MSGTKRKNNKAAAAESKEQASTRMCVICAVKEPLAGVADTSEDIRLWSEHTTCGEVICSRCTVEHAKACKKIEETASKLMWVAPWPVDPSAKVVGGPNSVWQQAVPGERCMIDDSHGDSGDGESGDPLVNNISFAPAVTKNNLDRKSVV